MTTLSKEDIVRMDSESGLYVYHNGDADIEQLQAFATLARADLVAENERLEDQVLARDAELWGSTQEILALKAENGRLKAIIEKQSDCEGEFCGKCYEQGLSESRTALPRDDSALREMIAGVYEECAKVCEDIDAINSRGWGDVLAKRIRALAEKANGE